MKVWFIYGREGPGVNYALNWALCAKGVAPKGEAYRNLRESELKKLNAAIPGRKSVYLLITMSSFLIESSTWLCSLQVVIRCTDSPSRL